MCYIPCGRKCLRQGVVWVPSDLPFLPTNPKATAAQSTTKNEPKHGQVNCRSSFAELQANLDAVFRLLFLKRQFVVRHCGSGGGTKELGQMKARAIKRVCGFHPNLASWKEAARQPKLVVVMLLLFGKWQNPPNQPKKKKQKNTHLQNRVPPYC